LNKGKFNQILLSVFKVGQAQLQEDEKGLYYANYNTLYNGSYQEFYNNGNLKLDLILENGVANGGSKLFFESGQLKEIRSYKNGNFNGL
jgi:antitoxin component YwqK of YwqJK toxin-antitoxin module